jgi:glycosyltransferase 2 family protein
VSEAPVSELPASHRAPPASEKKNPYLAFATRAGFGVIVISFLLWHYDARPVLRILGRENAAYFVATIVLYVAGQVMSAWRWQLLAAVVGARARFRNFLGYYFVGLFTNLFVPGLLGGDALRSLYLGRKTHHMGESIASVVADRGTGLIALFWLAAVMALIIPSGFSPVLIRSVVAIGAMGLLVVIASPLIAMTVPYLPKMLRRGLRVALPYMHRPQTTFPGLSLSFLLQVSLGVGQWILARGLGLSTPLSVFLLCVPIANVAAGFPVTLNGLGVRETAYLVLFGMAGMAHNDAIALGLLWFAATMLGGLTGAIAFALTEFPEAHAEIEKGRTG